MRERRLERRKAMPGPQTEGVTGPTDRKPYWAAKSLPTR